MRSVFRLFGFEVSVRPGFWLFTGLIVFLYRDAFGLWLAGAIAVLTLLHELGHAVAARSAGAHAAISLDFMAGYTSFVPKRPLRHSQRALISIAGPGTQIAISLAVLAAMGVNPLSLDSARQSDAAAAIWWAGPVIGLLNLLPVLPLDGGHLAQTLVEAVTKRPAMRGMAIASIVVTIGVAVAMAALGATGFTIFVAFLLIGQIQILQASSQKMATRTVRQMGDAETDAWHGAGAGGAVIGQRLSPWWHAHRAVAIGDVERARRVILDDLQSTNPADWSPPTGATIEQLRSIVDVLPDELPPGNQYSERVLADVLLAVGQAQRGGEYAAEGFARHRTSPLATTVARAAAMHGDIDNALAWLRAAAEATSEEGEAWANRLALIMDRGREFDALRGSPEFDHLRVGLS